MTGGQVVLVIGAFLGIMVGALGLFFRRFRLKAGLLCVVSSTALIVAANILATRAVDAERKGDAAAANAPELARRVAGTAKICITDDSIKFDTFKEIVLPSTTVFEEMGHFAGKKDDARTWEQSETGERSVGHQTALITNAAAVFTKASRCANVSVNTFIQPLYDRETARAADDLIFMMSDVLDYPIPAKKPGIELGKLIDDISVKAILVEDVTAMLRRDETELSDAAMVAKCLDGAQKLAANVGATLGRQGASGIGLQHGAAIEASYGCPFGSHKGANLFVAWNNQTRPPSATADLISKAGEFLTGTTASELKQEVGACVAKALKPSSNEFAEVEFRGVKIECQAFTRDGGGGNVTIYRRFGAAPQRASLSEDARNRLLRESETLKAREDARAASNLEFAQWWLDPKIPPNVKTFAMMTARMLVLSERCPTWKPNVRRVDELATWAGVRNADIEPNGRYYGLMSQMVVAMREGAAKESIGTACDTARKNDVK